MESTNYTLYLLFYAGISNALVLTFQIQTISDKFGLESSIILLIIWHHSFLSSTENILGYIKSMKLSFVLLQFLIYPVKLKISNTIYNLNIPRKIYTCIFNVLLRILLMASIQVQITLPWQVTTWLYKIHEMLFLFP